ncbi:unnamed protein product [Adineta steineri]|nr:unnamed protein product [Adineta steineri]
MQRSKIIKHFIKIAKCCKDMKNFNSMFAIISGLDHKTVQRLQATWERVPDKYKKIFEELKLLLDISRNMSVYRNLLRNDLIAPPIIPMFPVCMKDLTFIHLGNQTQDNNLINFEKLRMISKEIRYIVNMSSSPYDISNMFDSPTSHSQIFAGFGHQPTTDSFATIRKHQTGMRLSIVANAKRIYDEALMVKKVKTYLNNAEIIEDEDRLFDLANQCEPAGILLSSTRKFSLAGHLLFSDNDEKTSSFISYDDRMNIGFPRARLNSSPTRLLALKNAFFQNVSTLKRRPSPSTSSLSSNSSCDRRAGSIQLTKFGTQSPDAVNKLLRLSDSNHQIKSRAPQKSNTILRSPSPLINNSITLTGLTSTSELTQRRYHHQVTKMRDANKLTSESSSLNLKPASSVLFIRHHKPETNQNNNDLSKISDSGISSLKSTDTYITGSGSDKSTSSTISDGFSSIKNRSHSIAAQGNTDNQHDNDDQRPIIIHSWIKRSKSQNELNLNQGESNGDYDDHEQVTAV